MGGHRVFRLPGIIYVFRAFSAACWISTAASFAMAVPGPHNVAILKYLLWGGQPPSLSYVESAHLVDVRSLFILLEVVSLGWLVPLKYKPSRRTSWFLLVASLCVFAMAIFRFESLWTAAHRLVFSNEYWLLPENSYLIEHFYKTFMPSVMLGAVAWCLFWAKPYLDNDPNS